MSPIEVPRCVMCDAKAITTAAQIPVCELHSQQYADEARQYLPMSNRPFYARLLKAYRESNERRTLETGKCVTLDDGTRWLLTSPATVTSYISET